MLGFKCGTHLRLCLIIKNSRLFKEFFQNAKFFTMTHQNLKISHKFQHIFTLTSVPSHKKKKNYVKYFLSLLFNEFHYFLIKNFHQIFISLYFLTNYNKNNSTINILKLFNHFLQIPIKSQTFKTFSYKLKILKFFARQASPF